MIKLVVVDDVASVLEGWENWGTEQEEFEVVTFDLHTVKAEEIIQQGSDVVLLDESDDRGDEHAGSRLAQELRAAGFARVIGSISSRPGQFKWQAVWTQKHALPDYFGLGDGRFEKFVANLVELAQSK